MNTYDTGVGYHRGMQFLRLLVAGLFVFFGLLVSVAVLSPWLDDRKPSPLLTLTMIVIFISLVVSAIAIFGPRLKVSGPTRDEIVEQLEADGLLMSENFMTRRAFQVEGSKTKDRTISSNSLMAECST